MNPGVIEEIGKVASGFVESLKGHPLVLALVVMNLALLVIVWLELDQVFRQQREVNALLSKCVDPEILRGLGMIK
jgi:hypothetical protein